MKQLNIVSVSGGKDSTALYLIAMEYFGQNFLPIFADTGHEHPVTINYVKNLHLMANGPRVHTVRADFTNAINNRRESLIKDELEGKHDPTGRRAERIKQLKPTGDPFADLIIWKGRAPSAKAQFCTEHLKLLPILFYLSKNYPKSQYEWNMYVGIRAGESKRRAKMQPFSHHGLFDCLYILPLLYETKEYVFSVLKNAGVPPNLLYAAGHKRIGCYPCIYETKDGLHALEDWAWDRLEYYESLIGRSWFASDQTPHHSKDKLPTVAEVREWTKTSRGGYQYNMFKTENNGNATPHCMSKWSICE